MRTLIDSTAWYAYFNESDSEVAAKVDALIRSGKGCTAGVVVAEVLDAVEDRSKVTQIMKAMLSLHYLEDAPEVWRNTANLSFRTRQAGPRLPLATLHIASLAQFYRIPILTARKRFDHVPGVKLTEL
jgi:predicted nucleic acid-binding protein